MFNWGLTIEDEDEFVTAVLAGQPEPPRYFAEMKRINREGPRVLGGLRRPQRLAETRLPGLLERGAVIIDARHAAEYAQGHIPGTINIPLNRSFTTWAGWLIPYDRDFYMILDDSCSHCLDEAAKDLAMIGLDRLAGYFGTETLEAWSRHGGAVGSLPHITARGLEERRRSDDVALIDVRGAAEWEAGHLPGAENIPVGYLTERLDELPREKPLVVYCQGGGRSAIAASLLRSEGFDQVINLSGGYTEWLGAGYPTEREAEGIEAAA
jgi:hydroxyacylglutathione hydrolase